MLPPTSTLIPSGTYTHPDGFSVRTPKQQNADGAEGAKQQVEALRDQKQELVVGERLEQVIGDVVVQAKETSSRFINIGS